MDDEIRQHDKEIVGKAIADLMKHFDTVQVFATRVEVQDGKKVTVGAAYGDGNWYARTGQVRSWIDTYGWEDPELTEDEDEEAEEP